MAAGRGVPGFFAGVVFYTLVRIAERRRRFDELSLLRAAGWGAVTGLLLPVVFTLLMSMGLGTWRDGRTPWPELAGVTGGLIPGCALAGSVSLMVARWWRRARGA